MLQPLVRLSVRLSRVFLLVASIGVTGSASQICLAQAPLIVATLLDSPVAETKPAIGNGGESASTLKGLAHTKAGETSDGKSVASGALTMITTTVRVSSAANAVDTNEGYERRISTQEVERSAGTFGDPGRFMQTLPGVVSDNDNRNDFIVRGGNPAETLFVLDNVELPSINHLALSDTTGGFVSMIDNAAVKQTTLHTDAYDSKFDQRLSAVAEMSTRPVGPVGYHGRVEFGIGGAGGSMDRPLGDNGSMFIGVRRSVLNWFTDDIGMNGVPIYTNVLVRADKRVDDRNNWWGISLTGVDSIKISPTTWDCEETNPFIIDYSGWRSTTGINWEHVASAKSFGVLSLSNSQQQQTINDTSQVLGFTAGNTQAYYENTHDAISIMKYDWTFQANHRLTVTAGGQASLDKLNYDVQQPIGLPSPYSSYPQPADATSIARAFTPTSLSAYGQVAVELPHGMRLVAGERFSNWSITQSAVATGKAVLFAPIFGRKFHVGYAEYAQLPPTLFLLTFNNEHSLTPIRSRHLTAGFVPVDSPRFRLTFNAYQKLYSDYPVSVTFPQLSMANIADTFGQAFLMFPMAGKGKGVARGVEAALETRPFRRFILSANLTYMRSWYSGLDGVLRKGNFDMPLVANVMGFTPIGRGWTVSFRYSQATGRPYTPDDMPLSLAQNRDVYNMNQLNGLRAPLYSRLDLRGEWTHKLHRGELVTHVGLENALNKANFYDLEWMPIIQIAFNQAGTTLQQNQMPMFPDAGIRYSY